MSATNPASAHRSVTEGLAAFALSDGARIPDAVRHEAKRALLNFLGAALAGSTDPAVQLALAALQDFSGAQHATVIGLAARTDALTATYLNAISANALDFDDTHLATVIHPTAPVAPPLFACAERMKVSGKALLEAFVLGVEIACRLGRAMPDDHYRRGFHITGTCGVFGSAAAAGRLLAVDRRQMAWALGHAATQAAGIGETYGSMGKSINVGNAARNGLVSALLAQRGFTGPDLPIEGTLGFLNVFSREPDVASILNGIGDTWELPHNAYKPYPTAVVLHSVFDACLALAAKAGIAPEGIESVVVTGHPLMRERTDRPGVTTGRAAMLSLHHGVAVCFFEGAPGIEHYTDACATRPDLMIFRSKVSLRDDPAMPVGAATVTLRTRAGASLEKHIEHAPGSAENPLTDDQIEAKFRRLGRRAVAPDRLEELAAMIWSLEEVDDVAELLRLARPDAAHPQA